MKAGLVAVHYPHSAYREQMVARVRKAAEVMNACPVAPPWTAGLAGSMAPS